MRRLFVKFMLAFWLAFAAMALTAAGTAWLIRHYHPHWLEVGAGEPRRPPPIDPFLTLLQAGDDAGLRLLLQAQQHKPGLRVRILDPQHRPLPGSALSGTMRGEQQVRRPDGQIMTLQWLDNPPGGPPPHGPPPHPALLIGIALLVSFGFSAGLVWTMLRPIRIVRQALRTVAAGKLETRIGNRLGRRRDELAALACDFDAMARQLQQQMGAQQRLLHDVSHELRSPLARLQAVLGRLQQDPAQLPQARARMEREIQRLDALVDEVLTLARLESGVTQPTTTVDLIELLTQIADDAAFEAQTRGSQVILHATGEGILACQATLLYRSFENVVRNAVRHTPPGSRIDIRAQASAQTLTVRVCDNGPGVAPDQLQAIFEPFQRQRTDAEPGYGLGLAIARRAIESHGGTIRASLAASGGLTIEIQLPMPAHN